MSDMKKLKCIEKSSFTSMYSSISLIWGVIIVFISIISLLATNFNLINIPLLVIMLSAVVLILFFSIFHSFLASSIYNLLVNKIGSYEFLIDGMGEITKISTKNFSFITILIVAIISIIQLPILITVRAVLANNFLFSFISSTIFVLMLLIWIFATLVLFATIYNYLTQFIGGIKVKLIEKRENIILIDAIDPISLGLITSIVFSLINFIFGIVGLIIGAGTGLTIITQVINIILSFMTYFILVFVVSVISALLYNRLSERTEGIKIKLE